MDKETENNLGLAIDRVDSLAHGLHLPLPAPFHVKNLMTLLPEAVEDLKAAFVALTGENPWEE